MSGLRRSAILGLAFLAIMVDGFDLQAIGFVAPEIARHWSLPLSAFSMAFAATLMGTIPGAWLAGFIANKAGLRATLAGSLALFGIATWASAAVDSVTELAALRFIAGIGLGVTVPVTASIVTEHSPSHWRATFLTVSFCGQPLGAIAGAALSAHFIPIYGWQFVFIFGGIIPLLLMVLALALLGSSAEARERERSASTFSLFAKLFGADLLKSTVLLWISTAFASFFLYTIINWLPGAVRAMSSSLQMSISVISLFNFGGILGAVLSAPLFDRYGPRVLMPLLFGVASVATWFLGHSDAVSELYVAAAISGFAGYGGAMLLGTLAINVIYPAPLRTLGVGWMLGVGRCGAAVSPLVAGLAISSGIALSHVLWFAAGAIFLVMLCMLAITRAPSPMRQSSAEGA